MSHSTPAEYWLSAQTLATQRKLAKIQREDPSRFDDFQSLLAENAPLTKPSLLPALHNFWSCVPSKLAFQIAVLHCPRPADVDALLQITEFALLEPEHIAEFEELFRIDDPFDEVRNWLKDHAYYRSLDLLLKPSSR